MRDAGCRQPRRGGFPGDVIPGGDGASYRDKFSGAYGHRTLKGIGHNVLPEVLEAFAQAVVEVDGF